MKKVYKVLLLIIAPFIILTSTLLIKNFQLNDKLETKEEKEKELEIILEQNERVIDYLTDQENELNEVNFDTWSHFMQIAEHMYEDSEKRFKKEWGLFLANAAFQREIDPYILYELIRTETGGTFDPNLAGPETRYGQAYGLAQFMENTAPWIAEMADLPYNKQLLFDPIYSIELASVYLHFLYDRYEDWDYALTAYHRGIYGMKEYVATHGDAKSWYAEEIQENARDQAMVVFN